MGFRDDELAGRERIGVLERELEALREENASLRTRVQNAPAARNRLAPVAMLVLAVGVVAMAVATLSGWRLPTHGDDFGIALALVASLLVTVSVLLAVLGRLLIIVPPNKLVIVSGRTVRMPDGSTRGYRIIRAGRVVRMPLVERSDEMDLTPMEIDVWIRGAHTRDGEPVDLRFRARVELSRDERHVGNAVERFLGREPDEIARIARESLEGTVRGVAAQLRVPELREDALAVGESTISEAEYDFEKLGLSLESFHLLEVLPR